MITLSDKLKAVALKPSDQVFLAVRDGVRWSRPPTPRARFSKADTYERGKVKRVALAFLAGDYGAMGYPEIAAKEDISTESLKQTIWKERTGWKEKKRRKVA